MSVPIALRTDFDAAALRREAKATKDAAQGRRLLALAEVYNGGTRTDAARIGGVGLQTIRDWVLAFNGKGRLGWSTARRPASPPSSTTTSAGLWPAWSRTGRSRPFTAWCAGG